MKTSNNFAAPMFNTWFVLIALAGFATIPFLYATWQAFAVLALTFVGLILSISAKNEFLSTNSKKQ